jgi:pimeloyl-ACP methyl ester carboxylesterase
MTREDNQPSRKALEVRVRRSELGWLSLGVWLIASSAGFGGKSSAGDDRRQISVRGTELAYVESGQGEPIVLIHGAVADLRAWDGLRPLLAKRYRVVAYSRRFHAPNRAPADGDPASTHQLHAEDLVALIHELKLGAVHLVGHSQGGVVAALVAKQHPNLVRSVTLIEPSLFSIVGDSSTAQFAMQEVHRGIGLSRAALDRKDSEAAIRALVDMAFHPSTFLSLGTEFQRMTRENAASWAWQLQHHQPEPAFTCADAAAIQSPSLLIVGDRSRVAFKLVVDLLLTCAVSSQREIIHRSDHGLIVEQPRATARAIETFLKRLLPAGFSEAEIRPLIPAP